MRLTLTRPEFTALALISLLICSNSPASAAGGGPVFNPANGHHYQIVVGSFTWDQAKAGAEAMSYLGVQGHLVTYDDLAEDQFVYFTLNNGALGNAWIGLYQDTSDPTYTEPDGGWKWVTGEPLTWSNWGNNEPNNSGNAEHYGGYWPADQWNDYTVGDGAVGRYVVEFDTTAGASYCHGDGSASICPCGNLGATGAGCSNSTGVGAQVSASGTSSLGNNDLSFLAIDLVPGQTAILFEGNAMLASGNGILFGDGLRCAGGQLRRMGYRTSDAAGIASWPPGTTGVNNWTPGATRQFQVWYSDPGSSPCSTNFNTTNALEVNFMP
jgi:hypothetical protein